MSKKREKLEFGDLYKEMGAPEKDPIKDYPNKDQIQLTLPIQMTINGGTGSGKTSWLIYMLRYIGVFRHIYIIAKDLNEPIYVKFQEAMQSLIKKSKNKIQLVMSSDLNDVPKVDSLDGSFNSLVIIDDFIQATPKELIPVQDIYIRG